MSEDKAAIDQAYGSVLEGVFVAGFTFDRATKKIIWLLEESRFKQAGSGFDDVNKFLESIKLDNLKHSAEERVRYAKLVKELQPEATQRAIGASAGVAHTTIGRNLGASAPDKEKKSNKNKDGEKGSGADAPSGAKASDLVDKAVNKEANKQAKKDARAQKELVLGLQQAALPDKRYGVILADPEWKFEFYSERGSLNSSADNHYPTSALDAIKARDVPSIAADDAVLFMWATVPMLPQALEVMATWGFTYKSGAVWVKDRAGTGYWFRNQHELLLVGTRGNVPAPAAGTQWASVITAEVGDHSVKPETFHDLIEAYFPSLPKIELNRRGLPRPGWDAWGNEVSETEAAA